MWLGSPKNMKYILQLPLFNESRRSYHSLFFNNVSSSLMPIFTYLYRTIASVSVITVLTTAILIWVNIIEDDSILNESFEGLRLGKKK